MASSDAQIFEAALVDPMRFAAIFDRHIDPVRRYVVRRVGTSRSDDVVSEVFRIAFERRHAYDLGAESALPWLFGIAANVVRRDHRSQARGIAALERLGRRASVSIDPLLDAAERIDARNDVADLSDALFSLSEEEREVLLLVAWEELTPAQAAEALGLNPQTARTRLFRARQGIRRYLELASLTQEVPTDAT